MKEMPDILAINVVPKFSAIERSNVSWKSCPVFFSAIALLSGTETGELHEFNSQVDNYR